MCENFLYFVVFAIGIVQSIKGYQYIDDGIEPRSPGQRQVSKEDKDIYNSPLFWYHAKKKHQASSNGPWQQEDDLEDEYVPSFHTSDNIENLLSRSNDLADNAILRTNDPYWFKATARRRSRYGYGMIQRNGNTIRRRFSLYKRVDKRRQLNNIPV